MTESICCIEEYDRNSAPHSDADTKHTLGHSGLHAQWLVNFISGAEGVSWIT